MSYHLPYLPDSDRKKLYEPPHKVSIRKYEFADPNRGGRIVPVKFIYPAAWQGKALPVVLWSHGLGGSRDGAGFLARYLAAHGYIVVNIQHKGSDSGLWEGKPGHPWDVIRATKISRKVTLQRFLDVPFVLDSLEGWAVAHPDLEPILSRADFGTIGMSGHSFGAVTTQVVAGQMLGKGRRMYSLKDPRFKAAIAYSPSPTYNHREDHAQIYGSISLPMLHMTGTEDASPISGRGYEDRLPIFEHAGQDRDVRDQYLLVLDGGDHMVFTGSRGKLGANADRAVQEELIRSLALAFWDAYLKEDESAKDWLTTQAHHHLSPHGEFRGRR